jgi:hypothetical protein
MIEKPTILVTSIGRTGTEFFAELFANIMPNCTSLHEPDIIKFPGVKNRFIHYSQQIQRAGFWRIIVLKALGKWTLANVSDSRFLGNLNLSEATKTLHSQRKDFVSKLPGSIYVESNLGYYGLLEVIPHVFKNHRTIFIVRDGRDWVRSTLNWGEVYGKVGMRKIFAHKWPTAKDVKDDEYATRWDDFSRFEKLCWAWSRLNNYALNTISENPNAQVYKFESIFLDENRYQNLNDLLSFTVSLPGMDPESLGSTSGWLERKIHQSSNGFPEWKQWTSDQKSKFHEICGPQMERLGYGD